MAAQFDYDLRFLSDWELFDLIKKAKTSKHRAVVVRGQKALEEFRRRYQRHVNRFVRSARSRIQCSVRPEAVVEGVFDTVWEQADSFRHEPSDDEKADRHRVFLWLGSPICQNLIRQLNDKELLACAGRRNEGEYQKGVSDRAFAEFVRLHIKRLRWQCTQFTWGIFSEMEVEDLVQDTFIRAWRKAHTFKDDGISDREVLERRTDGWLNKMALRLFIKKLRGRKDVDTVCCEDEEELDRKGCRGSSGRYPPAGGPGCDPLSDKVLAALKECPDESARRALSEVLYGEGGPPAQPSTAAGGQSPFERLREALEDRAVEFTRDALLYVLTDTQRIVLQIDEQDFPDERAKLAAFRALGIKDTARRVHLWRAKDRIRKYVRSRMEEYLAGLGLRVPPGAE